MTEISLSGGVRITAEAFDTVHRVTVEFRRALRECSIELAKQDTDSSPLITTDVVHEALEQAFRQTSNSLNNEKGGTPEEDGRSRAA
jgi:hypothetical protein